MSAGLRRWGVEGSAGGDFRRARRQPLPRIGAPAARRARSAGEGALFL